MKKYYVYNKFEWETLSHDFSYGNWNLKKISLINKPISSFAIQRNKDLSISMIVNINHTELLSRPDCPIGTVINDFEEIEMSDGYGSNARATVTHIKDNKLSWDLNGNPINKAYLDVDQLEVNYSEEQIFYTIEWITNLRPEGCWHWPDSIELDLKCNYKKIYNSKEKKITIKSEDRLGGGLSVKCVGFSVNDYFVFMGEAKSEDLDNRYSPGFILYEGNPRSDDMEKIRLGLSYTLGRYLPSLGYSKFDKKWSIVSYKCIAPYHIEERVYSCQTKPPSKLKDTDFDPINSKIISDFVTSFYEYFDRYDLGHISWLYWHAVASPVHVQASQLGATIESIQKNYIKEHKDRFQTKLFGDIWKSIQDEIVNIINRSLPDNQYKNSKERCILLNKINNLNQTPQSLLTVRFFKILDLELAELETIAFKQRNFSAHGKKSKPGEFCTAIRNNDILRTLLNRVLIKILKSSSNYIDYYTTGHPQRHLRTPIGLN
jgi:hypothetical protein